MDELRADEHEAGGCMCCDDVRSPELQIVCERYVPVLCPFSNLENFERAHNPLYRPCLLGFYWSERQDLNLRPLVHQTNNAGKA